jgi:hypothetical protein
MMTDDMPALRTDFTSGLGYASQVISLTTLPVVSTEINTTAVIPGQVLIVVAGVQNKPAMKESPRLLKGRNPRRKKPARNSTGH